MSTVVLVVLGLAAGLLLILWFIDLLVQRPSMVAGMAAAAAVLNGTFSNRLTVVVGAFDIGVDDVVFGLILVAAVGRLLRLRSLVAAHWIVIAICLLALTPLVRGVAEFGVQSAFNEFRRFLVFLSPALYFSTVDLRELFPRRLSGIWIVSAAVLMAVVVMRWLNNFLGVPIGIIAADFGAPLRALNGPETFFLAEAFLLSLPAWSDRQDYRPWWRVMSILVGIFVLLLNRRTVWLTLVAALVVLVMRNQRLGRRVVALLVVGASVVIGVLLSLPDDVAPDGGPAAESATDINTFDWRVRGWSELLQQPESSTEWLFGEPYGSGFARRVSGTGVEASPHNFYLETVLRLGLLGLALLVALYIGAAALLVRRSRNRPQGAATLLLVLMTAQGVWLITWGPGSEQGVLVGLVAAAAVRWGGSFTASASRPLPVTAGSTTG